MSIYVLADLHLSTDSRTNKSMEVFGARWQDYISKIEKNWNAVVGENDTVVVPGDISWATRLEDAESDLLFLNSLNGKKLIGKGNHDFWWSTAKKMTEMLEENKIESIKTIYNNAHLLEDCVVCGTRGWFVEENQQHTVGDVDYEKIVNREVIRLRLSLDEAVKIRDADGRNLPILVFLHFPPVWNGFVCREIVDLLHEYNISTCYFGHIHGAYYCPRATVFEDIEFVLTAADALNFSPMPIYPMDF